jgi:class 3 adenylate cyclase/tetratricopeptide (TPR) repeat protein
MLTCPACGRTSPAEASFCAGCGTPLGATSSSREVRKTVTALFCDLVGSTALGETHDPEVLRPLLERYFAVARQAVERHGGRVEKFIGDAVSAIFGLPVTHEDDALRAVRAAMEIQARLEDLEADSPFPFAARVGVTTGEVLVPGDGTPLIGDAMNTAARLQAGAEPGQVLIGEPTYRLVRDAVVAEPVEPLALRGKAEPVPAFRVLRVASLSPMRTRRLDAPMVGRRREAALLESAFERAASDRACQLFTVLGAAGAGKSRLVEEFLGALADTDATVLRGRCLPYGEGITYYPVAEAVKEGLGLADFADAAEVRASLREAVVGEEHSEVVAERVAQVLGAAEGGSGEETFWGIRRLLEALARKRPLVVVFDDIHWGEPTFLDLVEHIADLSRDAPILLLCMARPDLLDVRPAWGGGKTNATTISLAPLSEVQCDEFIAGLLGSVDLPAVVRGRITGVAEGNPLFIEEMLRMLVDDGRLVRDEAGWRPAGDLSTVEVPPTISALLSARLDRLSDAERAIVEAAAVEGKEFHRGAIATLLGGGATGDLDAHLRSLVRKELIRPERSSLPGEDAYRFRHLLIRDAAYDAIPKAERATLHRAFADWLEQVAGDRIVEQEEIVGHHLATAYRYREELGLSEDRDLRLRAARALGAAGRRADDLGDARAAIDLLGPAADLAHGDEAELDLLLRLMLAHNEAMEIDEVRSVMARLEARAEATDNAVYLMRARMFRFSDATYTRPEMWDAEAVRSLTEEALRVYREYGAPQFIPQALLWLGTVEWSRGRATAMHARAREAFELALQVHDRQWTSVILANALGVLEDGPSPLTAVLAEVEEQLRRFAGDRAITASILLNRARTLAYLGRADDARADAEASRAFGQEVGRRAEDADYSHVDGIAAWSRGDLEDARQHLAEAHRIQGAYELSWGFAYTGPSLARVLMDLGGVRDAEQVLVDFRNNVQHPTARANAKSIAAVVAARDGDLDRALRLSREAMDLVLATDLLMDQGAVTLERAEVLLLAGRPAEARAAVEDALARFERKEYAIGIRRAREFLTALPAGVRP